MKKSPSVSPDFSVRDFFKRFPNDDACLAHVMEQRYGFEGDCPHCGVETTFHKMTDRKAYAGAACGCHIYPCAGTIFQDSRTPLQTWYYAIYLFIATRHGVSGKELQRTLGVTYKTAWRIGQQIRDLMAKADGFQMLKGHVEADETYVGGRRPGKRGRGAAGKTIVMGMKEREGRIQTEVIPDVRKPPKANMPPVPICSRSPEPEAPNQFPKHKAVKPRREVADDNIACQLCLPW